MPEELDRQAFMDEEHLRLVSLGFMISAGIGAFFAMFGLIYVVFGIIMSIALSHVPVTGNSGGPPPAFVGWIFAIFGLIFMLVGAGVTFARFWAARCVKQRKSRVYCMVIAAIGCLEFPYGTAFGVLSLMVLGRKSVMNLFPASR